MVDKNAKCDHSQMIEALQQKYKETKVKLNDKQSKKDKKDKKDKVEKSEKKTKAEDDEDDEDDEKPSS